MFKLVAIIGGVLVMAGAALAGTLTSLGSTNSPAIGQTPLVSSTTTTGIDDRGRENEVRGRANEAGEDLRGPCDEAEHATDPRCTGVAVAPPRADDNAAEDRIDDDVADDRGDNRGPGSNSGPSDSSGHGSSGQGGGDEGGHSGHGGHGGDD